MFRKYMTFLMAAVLAGGLSLQVRAAEVESGSVYCFSAGDFSEAEDLDGICITELPGGGDTLLGSRVLRKGDILTAEQLSQMTFCPGSTEADASARLSYLPVFGGHVSEEAVLTLSIRGKEDKAPVAQDMALETYKNLECTGKLKVSDPEGQTVTISVTRQPRRGTVTVGKDGSFTYTPKKNKVGIDSFAYVATDPAGKVSREATVTLTILKPTDATQYTDTLGKDCRFAAEWMKNSGIFVGEQISGNACFSPEREVTRGEFLTMLVKTLDIPVEESLTFTGYEQTPLWLQPYLAAAVRAGLTAGLESRQTFGAELPILPAEAAVMLKNATDREFNLEGEVLTRADAARLLYECTQLPEDPENAA